MEGACSTYGREEKRVQSFGRGKLRERSQLGRLRSRWEGIILKWFFRKLDAGGRDWIEVAQNTDGWRAPFNGLLNFWVQ